MAVSVSVAAGPVAVAKASERVELVKAAEEQERLWEQTKDPQTLARAAEARAEAGQYGQAIDLFRQLLTLHPKLDPALARVARNGMLDARSHTLPVLVTIEPIDLPDGATLTLRNGSQPDRRWNLKTPLRALKMESAGPRVYRLELEPGSWSLSLAAPGFREGWSEVFVSQAQVPAAVTVNMVPDMGTVDLSFQPVNVGVQLEVLQGPGLAEPSVQRVANGRLRQNLRVGEWVFEARAAGYRPLRQHLMVRADRVLQVDFQLVKIEDTEPTPAEEQSIPPRTRKLFAGTLGGIGIASAAAGIGFVVGGYNRQTSTMWLNEQAAIQAGVYNLAEFFPATTEDFERVDQIERIYPKTDYINEMAKGLSHETTGTALLGASVGLGLTAVTGYLAPVGKKGEKIWLAELGVGAGFTVVGGLVLGIASVRSKARLAQATPQTDYHTWRPSQSFFKPLRIQQNVAGVFLGAGIGTVIGAATGYGLWRRAGAKSTAQLGSYVTATGGGLTLQGQF